MTVNFRLAHLFFWRSLQVRPGLKMSPKEDLWGLLVQDFFTGQMPSCYQNSDKVHINVLL